MRVLLFTAFIVLLGSAGRASVVSFNKQNSTTVTSINNWPGDQKKVLYTIGPLTVQAGDVVSAHFQQQFNYTGGPVGVSPMVASEIVVGTSAAVVDQFSPGFVGWIARPAGANLSINEEISVENAQRTGSYPLAAAASNIYINAVAYGATPSSAPDLVLPAGDYGELVAVVERGVTWFTDTSFNLPKSGADYVCPIDAPTQHIHYSIGPISFGTGGTICEGRYDVEATTSVAYGQSTRLGRSIIQATAATSTTPVVTLLRQAQGGITRGEHHGEFSHVGGAYYGGALTNGYFNVPIYAYSDTTAALLIEGTPTDPNLYGHFVLELRPAATSPLYQDTTRGVTTVTTTAQVVYSVGPIDIAADQVVEVRYMLTLDPAAASTVACKIIRATSPAATTGTVVLRPLTRRIHPNYVYNLIVHSTAERPAAAANGQYYNVVAQVTAGASCPVHDWGELEAVKR